MKDPFTKLIVVSCISLGALAHSSSLYLSGAALAYFWWTVKGTMPLSVLLARVRGAIVFLSVIVLVNALSGSGRVLWGWAGLYITMEGMEKGINQALRLVMVLWGASLLVWTTPVEQMLDAGERWTTRKGRPLIAAGTIALNYLPLLVERARRVNMAHRARGERDSRWISGTAIARVSRASMPLFAAALRDADALAEAMESRCYEATSPRTQFRPVVIPPLEATSALFVLGVTAASLIGIL